jgi:hypothetical protein
LLQKSVFVLRTENLNLKYSVLYFSSERLINLKCAGDLKRGLNVPSKQCYERVPSPSPIILASIPEHNTRSPLLFITATKRPKSLHVFIRINLPIKEICNFRLTQQLFFRLNVLLSCCFIIQTPRIDFPAKIKQYKNSKSYS